MTIDAPLLRHGRVLVVFEGLREQLERRAGTLRSRADDRSRARAVRGTLARALADGGPLLVVLDRYPGHADLPALDWLPEQLRERGQQCARKGARIAARTPLLLLPQLLVEEAGEDRLPIRFARRTSAGPICEEQWAEVTAYLFTGAEEPEQPVAEAAEPLSTRSIGIADHDLELGLSPLMLLTSLGWEKGSRS